MVKDLQEIKAAMKKKHRCPVADNANAVFVSQAQDAPLVAYTDLGY